MSAPLSGPLFHGSSANIKPGEIISPKNYKYAFATNDPDHAWEYAQTAHLNQEGQTAIWNPVYKVSPVDEEEMRKTSDKAKNSKFLKGISGVYASKKGFKVEGVHELVENPWMK